MMVVDPVIGVSLGGIVFGESFATGLLAVAQAAGLAVTLAGVWLLATGERAGTETGRAPANAPLDRDRQPEDLQAELPG
jgi:hypothetical protein